MPTPDRWPTGRVPQDEHPRTATVAFFAALLAVVLIFGLWVIPQGVKREAHREAVAHKIDCKTNPHKGC